ncbi:MAG: hypothetical protein ACPGVH_03175 [Chitinophagales bacterium]
MKKLICNTFTLMLFFCSGEVLAQEIKDYNKALIWRGFEHQWTYNHRINRLGDFVSMSNGKGYTTHSSASGVGSDSTLATTHYTYLETPDVAFKETELKIFITGNEGELLTQNASEYLDLEHYMLEKENYYVILNGFEIKSVSKADQLHLFRFYIEDPVFNEQTNQLLVKGSFNLVTNCRTLECAIFNNTTAYELTLKLLVFAYDNKKVNFNNNIASRNYVWDTEIEVKDDTKNVNIYGIQNSFSAACVGIKGMSYVLDEEHWVVELNGYTTPKKYDPESGIMNADVDMKLSEWKSDMNTFAVSPFLSKFSKRKSGYALLNMNIVNIQFSDASIIHGKQISRSFWIGKNKDSGGDDSYNEIDISRKLKFNN